MLVWYCWFGRNHTKANPNAPHPSGGSGVLVHESIKHRVSILSKPTYGDTEGVIWLKLEHGRSSRCDAFCSLYLEQQRVGFPTNNEKFLMGSNVTGIGTPMMRTTLSSLEISTPVSGSCKRTALREPVVVRPTNPIHKAET